MRGRDLKWTLMAVSILFLALATGRSASAQEVTAERIFARNLEAAGEADNLARFQTVSFRVGSEAYAVSREGRMKVRYAFEEPAVYETLLVDGTGARRNCLGRMTELSGIEQGRWLALSRLISGLFTLKNFKGSLSYEGLRIFGPEHYHVLSTPVGQLRAMFYVDAADSLLKRMVLTGKDADGEAWEQSCEFGAPAEVDGLSVPSALFVSQVGVQGTGSPRARPITDVQFNKELPEGFFETLDINAGRTEVSPGKLEGNVLYGYFDDDECFVLIFTNWTAEDVRAAGLQKGDRLVFSSGGAEFESRFYFTEDGVDPTVYEPGNSLFTHNAVRYPLFYCQFNTLLPKERYEDLKSRIKILAPISARKKT